MTFYDYMRTQFRHNNLKIVDVARISGISENYMYKIMSGLKTTTIRDYVIAMCMAGNLDLNQTQEAISLNGMNPLDDEDLRDACIIRNINDHRTIRLLNQSLEDLGLPELKVRTDV